MLAVTTKKIAQFYSASPITLQVNLPTNTRSPLVGSLDKPMETTCAPTLYPLPTARMSLSWSSSESLRWTTPQKEPFRVSLIAHFVSPNRASCWKIAKMYLLPNLGLPEDLPHFRLSRVLSIFQLASILMNW